MKMAATRKKMAAEAKETIKIKQEEELTKRNVKTLIDSEVAEHERSEIMAKRYASNFVESTSSDFFFIGKKRAGKWIKST